MSIHGIINGILNGRLTSLLKSAVSLYPVDFNFLLGVMPPGWSFSRPSNSSYFDKNGILQQAANNLPRFDYDPVTHNLKGLLIEEQRQNLVYWSGDQTNHWAVTGSPARVLMPGAPDGSASFTLLTRTTAAATYLQTAITKAANNALAYVFSFYAKKGANCDYIAARIQGNYPNRTDAIFNLASGTVGTVSNSNTGGSSPIFSGSASIVSIGGGVYRCSLMTTGCDASTNLSVLVSPKANGNNQVDGTDSASNSDAYIWGLQLEQATFPTSYIPTTSTAPVTRAADVLSVSLPSWLDLTKGTFAVDYDLPVGGSSPSAFEVNLSNAGFNATVSTGLAKWWNGSSNIQTANGIPIGNTLRKEALAYTTSNRAICLAGGAVASDANAPWSGTPTAIRFGSSFSNTQSINGHLARFRYWNNPLSIAQLQQVTQ